MFGHKHILAIGINSYTGKWRALDNPVSDAMRFHEIMRDIYGFTSCSMLLDAEATKEAIQTSLLELADRCIEDDQVIIYFAGHGELNYANQAFWVPYGADENRVQYYYDYELEGALNQIQAKHVLVVSDSCLSGKMFRNSASPIKFSDFEDLESRPSRWIFASGEGQVGDGMNSTGSAFNKSLCTFLEENRNRDFSAYQLCEHVTNEVKQTRPSQTPVWRPVGQVRGEHGQMIFRPILKGGDMVLADKPGFTPPDDFQPVHYHIPRLVKPSSEASQGISVIFENTETGQPLQEVIALHKKIVVLGTAGSGKSVEFIHLARFLDKETPLVPFYRRLNNFSGEDIVSMLTPQLSRITPGLLVLLLDGLDEVPVNYFPIALNKITAFAEQHPDTTILVSCRSNFFDLPGENIQGSLPGFKVYHLSDLTYKAIGEFATSHFQIDGQAMLQQAYELGILSHLQKPFFLNTAIRYYRKFGSLAKKRSLMMKESLEDYYVDNKIHYTGTIVLPPREVIFAQLQKIAFVMEVMGRNYVTDGELFEIYPDLNQYGKLNYLPAFRRIPEKEYWMFEHNNIQEYLAAKVLESKPFDSYLSFITYSLADTQKIKPTWVNTVSFFVSAADPAAVKPLIEWIQQNDPEVLVRFENGRLDKATRIESFKSIFNYYDTRQIWIHSNKFSDKELAAFGNFPECIEFLLEQIDSPDTTRKSKLNALLVLDNYNLREHDGYYDRIKTSLFRLLDTMDTGEYDPYTIQSTIKAFAHLGITDRETMDTLVARYRNRKNQHIRAGLYKLFHLSPYVHEYIDVLLEGMDLTLIEKPVEDRENTNLLDEHFHLTEALEKISRPREIGMVFRFLGEEKHRNALYGSDFKEVVEALIKNAIAIYPEEPDVFDSILDFFRQSVKLYHRDLNHDLLPFFIQTGTVFQAFRELWQTTDEKQLFERSEYLETLMDNSIIDQFLKEFLEGIFSRADFLALYDVVLFNRYANPVFEKILLELEAFASQHNIDLPEKPPKVDYWGEQAKKTQQAFNLLFDKPALTAEIQRAFELSGKDQLAREDLSTLQIDNRRNKANAVSFSAIEILRDITDSLLPVSKQYVEDWLSDEHRYTETIIQAVYHDLKNDSQQIISLNEKQTAIIHAWCLAGKLDERILWYFMRRTKAVLPEQIVLPLTRLYDYDTQNKLSQPGMLDMLEDYAPASSISKQVIVNIREPLREPIAWAVNASYALRKNITDIYEEILTYIEQSDSREYKLRDILELWYTITGDNQRLLIFSQRVSSRYLRWQAIETLVEKKYETDYLKKYLSDLMDDASNSDDDRFKASNLLNTLADMRGFMFQAQYILQNPDPKIEFDAIFKTTKLLTDPTMLEPLMQLLTIAIQPAYQANPFNMLDRHVYDGIYNIGVQSEAQYLQVREILKQFIEDNKAEYPNIYFLEYHIKRIEEQLAMTHTTNLRINQAIAEYDRLKNA